MIQNCCTRQRGSLQKVPKGHGVRQIKAGTVVSLSAGISVHPRRGLRRWVDMLLGGAWEKKNMGTGVTGSLVGEKKKYRKYFVAITKIMTGKKRKARRKECDQRRLGGWQLSDETRTKTAVKHIRST